MSSYSSYSAPHDQHYYPTTPGSTSHPPPNATTGAMIPHPQASRHSSYSQQQLQPVVQQENYYQPEHPGYPRQSSHYSHRSHHSHHHHDSNTTTESDEERRYRLDKELERRPTLGGSLLAMLHKVGKMLGSERR